LVNGKVQTYTHTNDDYIKIPLSQQLPAGKVKVKVAYGGKPAIAIRPPWTGGFQWKKIQKEIPGYLLPARVKEQKFISLAKIIQAMNRMRVLI
jgi:hypothetical protein